MVPGVFIQQSTKSILFYGDYPKSDMLPFPPGDIQPDYEWLIVHIPFQEPPYDPRIYLLVTNVPDMNLLDEFQEHPLYPGLREYRITYSLEKRSNEDIIYSIENALKDANDRVWAEQVHKTDTIYMLHALHKLHQGFALTQTEQGYADKIGILNMKLLQNIDNRNLLESQVLANQEPNIDSGWVSEE